MGSMWNVGSPNSTLGLSILQWLILSTGMRGSFSLPQANQGYWRESPLAGTRCLALWEASTYSLAHVKKHLRWAEYSTTCPQPALPLPQGSGAGDVGDVVLFMAALSILPVHTP